MNRRYFPTTKDLIYSAIAGIHNHRFIKNPIVYSPLPDIRGKINSIPISRYRTYDGKELIEPGLTLAIYPASSNRSESSAYSNPEYSSAVFKPYELGPKNDKYQYEATYNLIVALYYQETAINEVKSVVYYPIKNKSDVIVEDRNKAKERSAQTWKKSSVNIEINVGEDILRDYIDVIRLILEEISIDGLMPWRVRGSQVTSYDFPTTSWSASNENIYFHYAYLRWELSMFAPAIASKKEEVYLLNSLTLLKETY